MKLSLFTVTVLVFVALSRASEPDYTIKKADKGYLQKQAKVLSMYVGLGSDLESKHHHEHTPFPFNDAKYYKNPKVLEKFMKSYERGFIDRYGVFTMYCHKNRHDTFNIFDIMYFAKDFDTFYDIAFWARKELNPLQFFYTFTMAVIHREDTRGMYLPPVFEVFPQYFIQSRYIHDAAALNSFDNKPPMLEMNVNNTSWESSWHTGSVGGVYRISNRWTGEDYNSRLTYFREDAGWANAFEYWSMKFAPWLSSTEKYPEINFSRKGEYLYAFYKSILDRYNLNRMAFKLPATPVFETNKALPGYNSHITDYMGRSFLVRANGIVPEEANADAAWDADIAEKRMLKLIDEGFFFKDNTKIELTDPKAFDMYSKIVYGARDAFNSDYYKSLYFATMAAAKDVVMSPNDRDYTSTTLELPMTQTRDPAFYMVLSCIDYWFFTFHMTQTPYTKQQLDFPGVSMENFDVSKLMTYNSRRKFEMTNAVPFEHVEDRFKYRTFADIYSMDHKDFEYEFKIKSDKAQDAMIRVMIGPKKDTDGRILTFNQRNRGFVPLNKYIVKLNAGENIFKKHSFQPEFYDNTENFYNVYAKVNKSLETNEPFEYSELTHCGTPYNLQLPRGWPSGKDYVMFAMVTPYSEENVEKKGFYQCQHNKYLDQFLISFPLDRRIPFPEEFMQHNMFFKDVKIYHEHKDVSNFF